MKTLNPSCPFDGDGVQNNTFNKTKNRTENTKKGMAVFDRASSDRFLAPPLIRVAESSLFLGAASPSRAGATRDVGD